MQKIINGIKREVQKAKAKGVVLGLSGGIDSAVVAVLAQKALGAKRVLGLYLPCESNPEDLRDAKLIAGKFRLRTELIDLTTVFKKLKQILPQGNKLAYANLKPRLRMLTLYFRANALNYLVLGTGNRSELSVGYFTKYGDGGVDLLPIGGLLKTEVRQLAKNIGIPEKIIRKAPTAGLWKGQTDEGEMGMTYELLDKMLAGKAPRSAKLERMMARSQHKLSLAKILK